MTLPRMMSALSVVVTFALLAGGVFVLSRSGGSADDPAMIDGELKTEWQPGLQRATPYPTPDDQNAVSIDSARVALSGIPGLDSVVVAVEAEDASALTALLTTVPVSCAARNSARCADESANFQAVVVEDAGVLFYAHPEQVEALVRSLLAAGPLHLVLVTQATAGDDAGDYYMTFVGQAVDAGAATPRLFPGEVNGIALKLSAEADRPVREFSVLSPTWGPLEWVQRHDASRHVLIAPATVDGLVRIDD